MYYFKPTCDEMTDFPSHTIFISSRIRSNCSFLFHFSMKIMSANRIASDGTPRFGISGAILFAYVPKKDARLIWFDQFFFKT